MTHPRVRVLTEPVAFGDMLRLWGVRTWLLAAQCVVQGGQYIVAPGRPLHLSVYRLIEPIGPAGWRTLGALFVVAGVGLALARLRRLRSPSWAWTSSFVLGGALYGFLFVTTLASGSYLPSTLILPLGLCLGELDLIGRVRARRRLTKTEGRRECG